MKKFHFFKSIYCAIIILTTCHSFLVCRNPRRNADESIPSITVSLNDQENSQAESTQYRLMHSCLRIKPILFGFNNDYFQSHLLPEKSIEFRKKNGSVLGSVLSEKIENLVKEIKNKQRIFTDFSILKDTDFNYKTLSGLLVLKYKDYPFVLKISIEHPETMVQPLSKSVQAYGIFVSGGNLRHLTNFTRIPNMECIKTMLSYNSFYLRYLDFPRKWFFKPKDHMMLKIVWTCNNTQEVVYIPNIYATVSDFIESEPNLPSKELNHLSMKVAADTGFLIDPHAGNIIIEKDTQLYVLIDTEDFRIMVGLDKSMKATRYTSWLIELVTNSLKIILFRTKKERLAQTLYL